MKEKEKEVEIKPQDLNLGCGSEPVRPGNDKPGHWECLSSQWVWIEDIG